MPLEVRSQEKLSAVKDMMTHHPQGRVLGLRLES